MIGRSISKLLLKRGDEVAWLSRTQKKVAENVRIFNWNPENKWVDQRAIEWADAIINLAGESIGEVAWTKSGKELILKSRINAVEAMVEGLKKRQNPIKTFVGVSGVGIYGPGTTPNKENGKFGDDFPSAVAQAWEKAYDKINSDLAIQKSIIRLAVVLSTKGGALPKLMQPIQFGLGAAIGSGKQALNWIHIDDAASAFVYALDLDGIFNTSAPEVVDNERATKVIANLMGKSTFLPNVPEFVLKLALGDRSQLVTKGNVTDSSKLTENGFKFQFPEFETAVKDLIDNKK